MKLITKFMTNNDCYKADRKIKPKGIMVHSTATPGIMAADWFSRWNKSYKAKEINRQVCVHAFVDDKEVYQYLVYTTIELIQLNSSVIPQKTFGQFDILRKLNRY